MNTKLIPSPLNV